MKHNEKHRGIGQFQFRVEQNAEQLTLEGIFLERVLMLNYRN